jgi:hypothetical protein
MGEKGGSRDHGACGCLYLSVVNFSPRISSCYFEANVKIEPSSAWVNMRRNLRNGAAESDGDLRLSRNVPVRSDFNYGHWSSA